MIGRTITNIVKWISCKIILVIPQRQAPFCQFNRSHAIFLSVILMVNMLTYSKSKRSRLFVCVTYPNYLLSHYLNQGDLDGDICYYFSFYVKSRVKTFDHSSVKIQENNL